jgi:PP-loop superfamily ATP-utilizing enzyme
MNDKKIVDEEIVDEELVDKKMLKKELKEIAKYNNISNWRDLKKMTAVSFFKKYHDIDDEEIKQYFKDFEKFGLKYIKNMLITDYIKKYYFSSKSFM